MYRLWRKFYFWWRGKKQRTVPLRIDITNLMAEGYACGMDTCSACGHQSFVACFPQDANKPLECGRCYRTSSHATIFSGEEWEDIFEFAEEP